MDGVKLTREIRARWPRARVVVTSGAEEECSSLPVGVAFLPKPWRALQILIEAEKAVVS
jgi:DNA-binding NarL/FixJ family response regulator